jgi:CheY-like chemotaxis protein
MEILFLTTDLLFSSRVAGAAARMGVPVRTAGRSETLLEMANASDGPAVVILDLNLSIVDPAQLVPALRSAAHPPRAVIAYGPHVQEDRLAAAKAAGCDQVLTRGEFSAGMDEALGKWRLGNK